MAPGRQVPHLTVTTIAGDRVRYADVWQHRNLALVVLAGDGSGADYAAELALHRGEFIARQTELIVTRDPVPDVFPHGVVVADKWGEITHVTTAVSVARMPNVEEILEWVDFTRMRCPECEGEWQ